MSTTFRGAKSTALHASLLAALLAWPHDPVELARPCQRATLRSPSPHAQRDAFGEAVEALGASALASGASALVVAVDVGGERIFSRGFGAATAAAPPDGDTPFHAGPLLSSFLSVAALALAEEERLDLGASLAEHLPDLPYGNLGVRVDHLLTQTSGLPGYGELLRAARNRSPDEDRKRILAWLRDGPLDSAPGTCAGYSGTNDLLLGLVLERVLGTSVQAHLAEALFARADLDDTGFIGEAESADGFRASQHPVEQEYGGAFEDQAGVPPPFGAERLFSTANDLLRYERALVEERLLPAPALELRATPTRLSDGTRAEGGRGISLTGMGELACHTSGGAMGGERVLLSYFPATDTTIVVWARGDDAPVQQLSARVARALFELEEPPVRDLPTTPELRTARVGDYYAACTSHAVVDEQEHLVLYPPDGPRRVLLYQGRDSFVASDDPDVRVEFESEGGKVVAFVLTEYGVSVRARRLF